MTKRTRKTVWLDVNGHKNTLRGHFMALGYHQGYPQTVAKREGVKQSEMPIEAWRQYFGKKCKFCETPDNWQEIIYGSKRGSQKNRVLGEPINYPERQKEVIEIHSRASDFLTMPTVVSNPAEGRYY